MKKIIVTFAAVLMIGNAALFAQSTNPTMTPDRNSGTVKRQQPGDNSSSGTNMKADQTKPTSDQGRTDYHADRKNGNTNNTNANRNKGSRTGSSSSTTQPSPSTNSSGGTDGSSNSTTRSQQNNDNNSTTPATTTPPSTTPPSKQ